MMKRRNTWVRTAYPCLVLLLIGALLSGCDSMQLSGEVSAEADPPQMELELHNGTAQTIYYFAGDRHDLARVDLALDNFTEWPSIASGSSSRIRYGEIAFYDQGDTAALIYWTDGQGETGSFTVGLD